VPVRRRIALDANWFGVEGRYNEDIKIRTFGGRGLAFGSLRDTYAEKCIKIPLVLGAGSIDPVHLEARYVAWLDAEARSTGR
jgi:hypothetical protein